MYGRPIPHAGSTEVTVTPETEKTHGLPAADFSHEETVYELWREVGKLLSSSLPESTFRMWLDPLEPVGRRGETLFLRAPESVRAWAEKRYSGLILHAVSRVESSITRISFADLTDPDLNPRRSVG